MRVALLVCLFTGLLFSTKPIQAKELTDSGMYKKRMELYKTMEAFTQIPWYYLAAIDQYERSNRLVRSDLPKPAGLISIYFSPEKWSGAANPEQQDTDPSAIALFNGIGKDGNGDHRADRTDDLDVLYTMSAYLLQYGTDEDNIEIALWNYYQRDKAVQLITEKAKIYQTFGTIQLTDQAFPLPAGYNYSYRSTWGDRRGWGGRRIHEGTDIFADYGVPVRATCYGVVEMKGWNKYGGWRIGIRDLNNTYHYFAHMSGFAKNIKVGQVVKPGMVIGGVGSTGYGPPGTAGKFPPHLHYGMYKDNGRNEWSFDPYPYLRRWETLEKRKSRDHG
ncbi:M23 family metallopeptidase [Heyndrickxia acidiproducens]|jgi:murein DD-endopeptidase MepM/ murein hydrolase activator NlpD|uniref:M23 family metallopeptidase n=1 Tax=Heyndrickxia acidiproducens TaxID=1121084 RepID=UPI000368F7ED|nr:M23 family metallopeptidase [Heyndrickxia acidiproducens]